MSNLPVISGTDCAKVLCRIGYYFKRQESSHIILRLDSPFSQIVVPNHKILDRGTIRAIIRQAGISVERFLELLQ